MFEYRITALCSTPVKEVLSPYLDKLTPSQCLLFVRALSFGDNPSGITIVELQEEIKMVIKDEFDGEERPYPYTFLVPVNPEYLWLPRPEERKNAWVLKLKEIEVCLLRRGINAELGKYRLPERLS